MLNVHPGNLAANAYLTSVNPQTIIALPEQNVSFTMTYQIWRLNLDCGDACGLQLVFIASWIPWQGSVPTSYWPVYEGTPPYGTPGTTGSATIHLTVPIAPGTYYLWFCMLWAGFYGFERPTVPAHLMVIVPAHTVTVTSQIPVAVNSSPISVPLVPLGVGGIAVAVIGSVVVLGRKRGKLRIGRKHVTPSISLGKVQQKPTLSTGYPDLDGALKGGIPEGYAVVLVSPSYDERDLLLRRIIDSAISSGRPTFYISSDIERTQDLLSRYQGGFYAFSPLADKIAPNAANLYKIPYLTENLSEANISLTLAFKQARAKEQATNLVLVIDILSDLLVRYKAITTRRWLADFVGKRKVEGFTTLATLDPLAGTKEDNQMVIGFFDGVIEIFEKELKERSRRFLVVKKMYGKKYSESELMLDKDKLF
jgi:KaiC/GvpD/RAD55 family RecA-like ATPase